MSYVGSPFIYDVFVSYAHGDWKSTGTSPVKTYSRAFADILSADLYAHPDIGPSVSVFFDESTRLEEALDRISDGSKELSEKAAGSALLMVLLSPHYLKSKIWCPLERDAWNKSQSDLGLSYREHLALAEIWPTGDAELPPLFLDSQGRRLLCYFFYDRKQGAESPQPFDYPAPPRDVPSDFRRALLPLVNNLRLKLRQLKERLETQDRAREDARKLAEASNQVIYLHGRADERQEWGDASAHLSEGGYVVVPAEPDPIDQSPDDAIRLTRERIKTLRGCDAMMLVASDNPRAAIADLMSIGRQDRHAARATTNRNLPCALLDSSERLRANAGRLDIDWIDRSQTPWLPAVKQWLTSKSEKLSSSP